MKAPYFPLFVNNWLGSGRVSAMTPAEEGAYIRLLCYEWNDEKCSLPADDLSLATLSRLGVDWKHSAAKIRAMFDEHEGRLYSEKLLSLRMEADALREKKHSAGVKGMLSRWHNTAITKLLQNDNPTPTPTPTPTEQNKTPEENTDMSPPAPSVKKRKFTPPTVEEVNEYAQEKEYTVSGEEFIAFYESNGWKIGKNSMKDWRAAVRTWEFRRKNRSTGGGYGGKQTASERRAEQASREYEEHIVVPTL